MTIGAKPSANENVLGLRQAFIDYKAFWCPWVEAVQLHKISITLASLHLTGSLVQLRFWRIPGKLNGLSEKIE